jgi:hypothetical protein
MKTLRLIAPTAAALALYATAAAAQSAGGLAVTSAGLGPMMPPALAAGAPLHAAPADVGAANPARARSARDQQAVAQIRGDSGFLGGFFHGQPIAASRQPPPPLPEFNTFVDAPFIVNNFGNPVTIDAPAGQAPTVNAKDSAVTVNTGSGKVENHITTATNVAIGNNNVANQRVTGK